MTLLHGLGQSPQRRRIARDILLVVAAAAGADELAVLLVQRVADGAGRDMRLAVVAHQLERGLVKGHAAAALQGDVNPGGELGHLCVCGVVRQAERQAQALQQAEEVLGGEGGRAVVKLDPGPHQFVQELHTGEGRDRSRSRSRST